MVNPAPPPAAGAGGVGCTGELRSSMPLNWELINAEALAFLDLDGLVDAVSEKECMRALNSPGMLLRV